MGRSAFGASTSVEPQHLHDLESESIHIIREVIAEFDRPALLFSGGKDSAVLLHLAIKAVHPADLPFPIIHIDTGHNFPEVLAFRDKIVRSLEIDLVVGSVDEAIRAGRILESASADGSRNRLQTGVLLETIKSGGFTAVFGGARRDEERSRAKERIYSLRNELGQWDPGNQRPEIWNIYKVGLFEHGHGRSCMRGYFFFKRSFDTCDFCAKCTGILWSVFLKI